MLNFIKSLFGTKFKAAGESCGATQCCRGAAKNVDLGLSDADRAVLQTIDERIVVGKITAIGAHSDPKVTKVQVTQCDLGNGRIEQILCGGSNIAVDMVVPVATVGTDLGGGFVIGERAIRGEMSHGMICAQAELGLSAEAEEKGQIWPLPSALECKLGMPVNQL